ncbi:hypothetical protein CGRA01v4_09487 [Colletotrichum graminicola]|nr:hypothetical protein CGRA01v4_09487 [Colletotrichum graminicola]
MGGFDWIVTAPPSQAGQCGSSSMVHWVKLGISGPAQLYLSTKDSTGTKLRDRVPDSIALRPTERAWRPRFGELVSCQSVSSHHYSPSMPFIARHGCSTKVGKNDGGHIPAPSSFLGHSSLTLNFHLPFFFSLYRHSILETPSLILRRRRPKGS